jgi:UPF0755 protein
VYLSSGSKAFLALLVLVAGGVLWFLNYAESGLEADPDLPSEPVSFEVPLGISRGELSDLLEDEEIVGDARLFEAFARSDGFFETLEAGSYDLATNMSAEEVVAVFRAGPATPDEIRFTVEEGLSQVLTLERLAEQFDAFTVEDFQRVLDRQVDAGGGGGPLTLPRVVPDPSSFGPAVQYPFEGVLFPQTYRVEVDAGPARVLQRMIDQLALELDVVSPSERQFLRSRDLTLYDAMIIASLIERETRVDDERELVASVIYNRLAEGTPLQIDATVLYALGEWRERVLFEDTEIDSPYNTYNVTGLPPTPISGFGQASFRAALAPAETPFRYYVLTPECDGRHVFAETLAEHNTNVAAFRAADGCR